MTSSLLTLRTAILTTLAADARMTGVHMSAHGGDFDLEELRRYAKITPAAILAFTQVHAEKEGGLPMAEVQATLTIMTSDRGGSPRDVKALSIVDAVIQILVRHPNQYWGLTEGIGAPQDVKAANSYSRKLDNEGVAIWHVVWRQAIELQPLLVDETQGDFLLLHANWDLYPRDNDAPIGTPADPQPVDAVIDAETEVDL